MKQPFYTEPRINLGTYGMWPLRRPLRLRLSEVRTHFHCIGVSGSGKSRFLAGLYLGLLQAGLSATLIDPHGDLARLVLSHLVARGAFRNPSAFQRIVYLDLPEAERQGRFLPFNVLRQHAAPHAIASNIKEAMHRAWPQLAGGAAPMFDTLVQDGVKVLLSNGLPLTSLYRLLTDQAYRDELLRQEEDSDIVSFFHDQFDRLGQRDQTDQAGAALRRAHLLTFSPVLKYSLGQSDNGLNFRELLDGNRSVIINLALGDAEARRLLGCLLTVMAEQGALSRAELPEEKRQGSHYLVIDEFSEFTAQSEEALARILSLTRKYGLYLVMAHQTWSQASSRLQGALQNVGIEAVFQLGRADAELSAKTLGRVSFTNVKHEVKDEAAVERTHPVFYSLPEEWESWIQEVQELRPQHAYIAYHRKMHPFPHPLFLQRRKQVLKVKTAPVPNPRVHPDRLARVEEHYLRTCFRPKQAIEEELAKYRHAVAPSIRRLR